MAQRVAVTQITIGNGTNRMVIKPGEQFDTDDYGIDEAELAKLDEADPQVLRPVQESPRSAPGDAAKVESTEGRSGRAANVTSDPGEADAAPAKSKRQPASSDDL